MTLLLLLIGIGIGVVLSLVLLKLSNKKPTESSDLNSLTKTLTELKTKFEESEKYREKLDTEKEKRLQEFIQTMQKLFTEFKISSDKNDKEKEKRLKEFSSKIELFFKQQREETEKFLQEQGKSRQEIEKQRDAQLKDMQIIIQRISSTFAGTKSSGNAAEVFLKEVLKNSIKAGLIQTELKTDVGSVEFGWSLGDGKFIPIDSKFPHLTNVIDKYIETKDHDAKLKLKKQVIEKSKQEIKRVKKYQNLSNTIDSCVVVFPEIIIELAPEIISYGYSMNVYVCSYKEVFPIAHLLQEQYIRLKHQGNIGEYKIILKKMFIIVDKIITKTNAIERALTTIKNANSDIKSETMKAKQYNILNKHQY